MARPKNKVSLLEREIATIERENNGKVYTLPLSDLVMMQMVGKFEDFLSIFPDEPQETEDGLFNRITKIVEHTRKSVTTHKLFSSIVQKTIEAQFGDKHAALRELGQNGIDSYEHYEKDKPIIYSVSEDDEFLSLTVRDYGCGMDIKTVIRDLLVPYNSGKEFDLTKIGEHGIGWYSVVDLADVVKVTTRTRNAQKAVQAFVYNKDGWKTAIHPYSNNGFNPALHEKPYGTEVTAFIPKDVTNLSKIRDFLYQYLGMVDKRSGEIIFNKEIINAIRETYQEAAPASVTINKKQRPLVMGVSKRELQGDVPDARFKHRNKNLEKLLFTQRGLFIKYDDFPFDDDAIHAQLMRDMNRMGLDFWVDIPENVTLTKGRNNIIADHVPQVLEGMYKGFEGLFLDIILNDEDLVYHTSGKLLDSLAHIFDKTYTYKAMAAEKRKYGLGRRIASRTAAIGSGAVDLGTLVGKYAGKGLAATGKGLWIATKYPFTLMPDHLVLAAHYVKENAPDWGRAIIRGIRKNAPEAARGALKAGKAITLYGIPISAGLGGLGYGAYKIFEKWGGKPLLYTGMGAVAAVGSYFTVRALVKNWPNIQNKSKDLYARIQEEGFKPAVLEPLGEFFKSVGYGICEAGKGIGHGFSAAGRGILSLGEIVGGAYMSLLHKCGLYVNIEEKRERKREKRMKKISKRYMSKISQDDFLKKIMNKKIIRAEYYFYNEPARELEASANKATTDDTFISWHNDIETGEMMPYDPNEKASRQSKHLLEKKNVKLSIDNLINLHIKRKLKCQDDNSYKFDKMRFNEGDFFVDYNNPLVRTVMDKLQQISYDVRESYDVKVLEDRLDNLLSFTKGFAKFIYMISGLGVLQLIGSTFYDGIKNPIEDTSFYKKSQQRIQKNREKWQSETFRENLKTNLKLAGKISGYIAGSPFIASYFIFKGAYKFGSWAGKNIYEHALIPAAEALNPERYPEYQEKFHAWRLKVQKDRKRRKEDKIAYWKETMRERELIRQEMEKTKKVMKEIKKKEKENHPYQESFFKKLKDSLVDFYHKSGLYDTFGYGITEKVTFENLRRNKLAFMVEKSDIGRAYLDFMDSLDGIDKLVSKALNIKRFNIVFSYNAQSRRRHNDDSGFALNKKGILTIDLGQIDGYSEDAKIMIAPLVKDSGTNENKLAKFTYTLFDYMLHQKAHDTLKDYNHTYREKVQDSREPDGFYETKHKMRREFIDYVQNNSIDLVSYVRQFVREVDPTTDKYHYVYPDVISELNRMTLRRLLEENVTHSLKKLIVKGRLIKLDSAPAVNNQYKKDHGIYY